MARGDPEPRHEGLLPDHEFQYVILLHAAYSDGDDPVEFPEGKMPDVRPEGTELRLPTPEQEHAFAPHENYRDPVAVRCPEEYGGRWLAGVAPVGNTELWVIVQQKHDQAVEPFTRLARHLMFWLGIGAALLLLLAGAGIAHRLRWAIQR